MNADERNRRSTDEYLEPRRANGFGSPEAHANGAAAVNAANKRKRDDLSKMLKERLDDRIDPTTSQVLGTAGEKLSHLSRVEAALRVLDDALCDRAPRSGRCTPFAMEAAKFIINHRFGRPKQAIEIESSTETDLLAQLDRRLAAVVAEQGKRIIEGNETDA